MAARAGVGAHVNQQLDTGAPQYGGQLFHEARTVADGPDSQGAHDGTFGFQQCDLGEADSSPQPLRVQPKKGRIVPAFFLSGS